MNTLQLRRHNSRTLIVPQASTKSTTAHAPVCSSSIAAIFPAKVAALIFGLPTMPEISAATFAEEGGRD